MEESINPMAMQPDCSFVLSVEQGKLEAQAVLLVESLRRFGGIYSNCQVYAVSPRPTRQMSKTCQDLLKTMGVQIIIEELLSPTEEYGPTARLAACAWIEKNATSEILVSLDDDLFFTSEPDFSLHQADFFARPVDVKGMCTSGLDDPFDSYWRKTAQICGVEYEQIPWVETTIDRVPVKASYNGGMVAVRRQLGLFQGAEEMLRNIRLNNLAPRTSGDLQVFASTGFVGIEASQWWGTSQAVLSLAATQLQAAISIAPQTYNVPAHLLEEAKRLGNEITLKGAILVHYHWLLYKEYVKEPTVFYGGGDLPIAVLDWLKRKTPISDLHP